MKSGLRKISKKEKNDDGEWMYLTEWKFYDDVTWETADTFRVGAKDVSISTRCGLVNISRALRARESGPIISDE